MYPPSNRRALTDFAMETVDRCRGSVSARANLCRIMKTLRFTGTEQGDQSIDNELGPHLDRLASWLFSPSELRFNAEFEYDYPAEVLKQAEIAGRVVSRAWSRRNIDMLFGHGVAESVTYGATLLKQLDSHSGLKARLVMPWQAGVYNETENELDEQEAICETTTISLYDLWRRISHLPDGPELLRRARDHARRGAGNDNADLPYMHQVLIAGTSPFIQTQPPYTQSAGGLVQVAMSPQGGLITPSMPENLITFHELWVVNDYTGDYTTIQIAEPDILVAPRGKPTNMFVRGKHPYTLIQPNYIHGYIWGRSEMADLIPLQALLTMRLEDIKRLMGLQYDRMLAFIGMNGMTDEAYDQFRSSGYIAMESGGDVKDLTPKLPEQAFAEIKLIQEMMERSSGFMNIMSGQGEPGVRAGNHAQMLLRTASPRLRDRALLVERQVASAGDKSLSMIAAKEGRSHWTDAEKRDESAFYLAQLPDDLQVTVDSHSSSPIYEQQHEQLVGFMAQRGIIDGEDTIDFLPIPRKEFLKTKLRAREKAKAEKQHELQQLAITNPDAAKALTGKGGSTHHAAARR